MLRAPRALVAFGGWVDAGSGGTGAVRYLVDSLGARRLADLDPEDFYSFTDTRPLTSVVGPGQRAMHWPRGEFFAATSPGESAHDLLLFVAPEPNMRWRTYCSVVMDVLEKYGVTQIINLGAIFGAVHHRGETPLMGWATDAALREALTRRQITFSNYEGPTGIVTALLAEAQARGVPSAAIIGFTPNYVQGVANPRTSHALLKAACEIAEVDVPLADLERAGRALVRQVDKLLADQPELRERVERMLAMLQGSEEPPSSGAPEPAPGFDMGPSTAEPSGELPSPQAVVQELEQFLRQLRGTSESQPPPEGDPKPDGGQ